jgi:REP element-mobilizing transposase RayT
MRHEKTRFTPERDKKLVVFKTFRGVKLFDLADLKTDFVEQIRKAQRATGFHRYGWLILPDEVRLILSSTAKQSIRDILEEMKGRFATRMLRRFPPEVLETLTDKHGQPHFWHLGGGSDQPIGDDDQLRSLLTELHQEPVTRGLAATPTDWP